MAIGTSLAIAGIASAAGGAFNAYKQSSAAKKAAKYQTAATQQAQNYLQQGMGQIGQLYSPYINAAQSAANTRSRLTTPGPGATYASPGPPNVMPQFMQPQGPPGYAQQRPAGPYPMAYGGDVMVDRPTLFLAGEAGPERATFSGAQPPMSPPMQPGGWNGFSGMAAQGLPRGLATRPGALQGAMQGGSAAAGANALRGPFGQMYGQ